MPSVCCTFSRRLMGPVGQSSCSEVLWWRAVIARYAVAGAPVKIRFTSAIVQVVLCTGGLELAQNPHSMCDIFLP